MGKRKKLALVGSVAAVTVFLCWLIDKSVKQHNVKHKNVLERYFGKPIYSNEFTLQQAKDWLKKREKFIDSGCRCLLFKLDKEQLESMELSINSDIDNLLLLAIINKKSKSVVITDSCCYIAVDDDKKIPKNTFKDSLLIKYDSLEDELEELLYQGNGAIVIGG